MALPPNIHQATHILRINGKDGEFSREDLINEEKQFGLSAQKCRKVRDEVLDPRTDWEDVFEMCGVPEQHTQGLREKIREKR